MDNVGFALDGAWRVLLAGLVLGAGLPAVYAVGIRSLASGGRDVPGQAAPSASPWGMVAAGLCLVVVLIGVALGMTAIISSGFGKQLDFAHVYPTLVDKE